VSEVVCSDDKTPRVQTLWWKYTRMHSNSSVVHQLVKTCFDWKAFI